MDALPTSAQPIRPGRVIHPFRRSHAWYNISETWTDHHYRHDNLHHRGIMGVGSVLTTLLTTLLGGRNMLQKFKGSPWSYVEWGKKVVHLKDEWRPWVGIRMLARPIEVIYAQTTASQEVVPTANQTDSLSPCLYLILIEQIEIHESSAVTKEALKYTICTYVHT